MSSSRKHAVKKRKEVAGNAVYTVVKIVVVILIAMVIYRLGSMAFTYGERIFGELPMTEEPGTEEPGTEKPTGDKTPGAQNASQEGEKGQSKAVKTGDSGRMAEVTVMLELSVAVIAAAVVLRRLRRR